MKRTRPLFALLVGLASSLGCGAESDAPPVLGAARAAIVGNPALSTSAEDFIVFLGHIDPAEPNHSFACGATLVAPNLVLTAKHCVNHYTEAESLCDATGEPQVGSAGGYTTGALLTSDITFHTGVTGRARSLGGEPPDAVATKYFDDGTNTLCSHDLAYVLLDRPITNVPVAKLRLGRRPQQGDALALAGWGTLDHRLRATSRYRRSDLLIQRVGPVLVGPNPTGSLGPRTFESGPAGCTGDSGSPGFDPATGTVFGVIARAGPLDSSDPISPCAPQTVVDQYMVVADFAPVLREAFTAASAEPWLEGHAAAGFARFGEACSADLECAGAYCLGATDSAAGTCNVHCGADVACPTGLACDANGACQTSAGSTASTNDGGTATTAASGGGCATTPSQTATPALWMIGLCLSLAFRSRNRRPRLS